MRALGLRLAIRPEGKWVKAYVARLDTMEEAILVATILKKALTDDRKLWEDWKRALSEWVAATSVGLGLGEGEGPVKVMELPPTDGDTTQ